MGEDPLTKGELSALLANHLQRLPPSERRVLFRRLFHQPPMSSREIGHDLGITEGQARHLEVRALRRLRSFRDRGMLFDHQTEEEP